MSISAVVKTFKAVAWSFFGVRSASALEADTVELKPFAVIAVGLVSVIAFVGCLMLFVRWVVSG